MHIFTVFLLFPVIFEYCLFFLEAVVGSSNRFSFPSEFLMSCVADGIATFIYWFGSNSLITRPKKAMRKNGSTFDVERITLCCCMVMEIFLEKKERS